MIYQLKARIFHLQQDKKEIREEKNVRYNKLRWKLLKRDQRIYVLLRIIRHRHRIPKKKIQNKSYRAGMMNANRTAKGKWLNKGIEKGRLLGFRMGIKEGKSIKATNLFHKGVETGKRRLQGKLNHQYDFRRRLLYKVESVSRIAIVINRLSKTLGLSLPTLSFLFWCSQHEYWTKKDVDRAFNDIGFDEYYTCVSKLKNLELIEPLKKNNILITWRLTYKGKVLTTKMNAYMNRYFNKKLNK